MKKRSQYYLLFIICLGASWLNQSCKKQGIDYQLAGGTRGIFEWVSTTTPSHVSTPQSVGYTKQLAVLTDNQGAYVGFYKNDTLQRRIYETSRDTAHTFTDDARNTVLIKYKGDGFIKYYITTNTNGETITISELLNPYSLSADTTRSVYRRTSKSLYPY